MLYTLRNRWKDTIKNLGVPVATARIPIVFSSIALKMPRPWRQPLQEIIIVKRSVRPIQFLRYPGIQIWYSACDAGFCGRAATLPQSPICAVC